LSDSDLSEFLVSSIPHQVLFRVKHQTPAQRNILMTDLIAAESTRKGAVVEGTNAKFALAWKHYKSYLISIGINNNWYLNNFSREKKIRLLGAFCNVIREGQLHSKSLRTNKSESVRAILDNVSQAFKLAGRSDPRLDRDGKFAFVLQRQLRGYRSSDVPVPEKRQIAISGSVLHEFYRLALSNMDKARCELFIGAFFFAMRSCVYVTVYGKKTTKLLSVKNIRFFTGKRMVNHSDNNLHFSSSVSITFEEQKRGTKNDTITHHRTNDPLLCPVKIWSKIIKRILSYPSSDENSTVNTFQLENGTIYKFSGKDLLMHLRRAADSLGPHNLGYTSDQIGLHSA